MAKISQVELLKKIVNDRQNTVVTEHKLTDDLAGTDGYMYIIKNSAGQEMFRVISQFNNGKRTKWMCEHQGVYMPGDDSPIDLDITDVIDLFGMLGTRYKLQQQVLNTKCTVNR